MLEDGVELPLSRGDQNKLRQALREQDRLRRVEEARRVLEAEAQGG